MTRTKALYLRGLVIVLLVPIFFAAFMVIGSAQPSAKAVSCPATLRYGSTGKYVRLLQEKLNILGIGDAYGRKLKVDGIFGSRTREAVMNFQKRRHLTIDGIVGPKTWAALGVC